MHKPIQFKNLSLSFPHKTCFLDFNGRILSGDRIAIIGRNGSGKSTLLKMIQRLVEPSEGEMILPKEIAMGYLPQVIDEFDDLSGGQRLNAALTQALLGDPSILLLDEPTNHLDRHNRCSMLRLLRSFTGTLIVASHDIELLRNTVDTLWHIDNGRILVFSGSYDDYQHEIEIKRLSLQEKIAMLDRQKKENHHSLMKEQVRAKNSRIRGEKFIQDRKWPTIRSATKTRNAVETSGSKQSAIKNKKQILLDQLSEQRLPAVIKPNFSLNAKESHRPLISINQGQIGYDQNKPVLMGINFSMNSSERVAIVGDNGSGKSTFIKAILNHPHLIKKGQWNIPNSKDIGYLDQHYATLSADTVLDVIANAMPNATCLDIRKHLNDFLFCKNEAVEAKIATLSGGEKARLSLAQIAAISPKLLILDEMTNNLDLETRAHVIEVLQAYPGAMIVISHDDDFLSMINITTHYQINQIASLLIK